LLTPTSSSAARNLCIPFAPATHAVAMLLKQSETVFFCPQNVAEFWNLATRPSLSTGSDFS
jgi:hypothetical protein